MTSTRGPLADKGTIASQEGKDKHHANQSFEGPVHKAGSLG
jgi:hypothetical protein